MRQVASVDWVAELATAKAAGFDLLDMITGVDRLESIEVIASVAPGTSRRVVFRYSPSGALTQKPLS